MKHGWMLWIWLTYISLFTWERWVTAGAATNYLSGKQEMFLNPSWLESSNLAVAAVTIVNYVAPYLKNLVQVIFLYEPTIFAGGYLYLWWYVCFPAAAFGKGASDE